MTPIGEHGTKEPDDIIGTALTTVQLLPPGIYVAMNECVFDADKVRKNHQDWVLEPTGPRVEPS